MDSEFKENVTYIGWTIDLGEDLGDGLLWVDLPEGADPEQALVDLFVPSDDPYSFSYGEDMWPHGMRRNPFLFTIKEGRALDVEKMERLAERRIGVVNSEYEAERAKVQEASDRELYLQLKARFEPEG